MNTKQIEYHKNMARTLREMVCNKQTTQYVKDLHEWGAHTGSNGLKKSEFVHSGYGYAMRGIVLAEKHEKMLKELSDEI